MSDVSPRFQPAEEQLRETVRQVLTRPDYQLDPPAEPSEGMLHLLATLFRWLMTPFKWLFDMTEGLPDFLRWLIVIVLVVVLVACLVHMAWTLMQAMSGGRRSRQGFVLPTDLASGELSVAGLEQAADQAFQQGALIEAVRFLFRAALTGLSEKEKKKFRRGMTNRQYLNYFRNSSLLPHLQIFVNTIELKWYGDEPCENHDYDSCREAYQRIVSWLRGGPHADAS
jgi:hypothetical protein